MVIVFGLCCNYPSNVKGSPFICDLYSFGTDKDVYYNDEVMQINATYELNYNPPSEISWINIQIFNETNHILWETIEYHEEGNFSRTWYVEIKSLDLAYENESNSLYVKFYWFFSGMGSTYLGELECITIKRNVSCELIGFNNYIKYGEDFKVKAQFYNSSFSSGYYVKDQQILVEILLQNFTTVFSKFLITNSTGELEIFILTVKNLSKGVNYLRFTIVDSHFFNSNIFEYEFYFEIRLIESLDSKGDKKEEIESSEIDQFIVISLSLVVSSLIGIVLFLHFNNMKKKPRDLYEISFKV